MIIVTGAAGFIGSCLVKALNEAGYKDLILVDDFSNEIKNKNLTEKVFKLKIHRDDFAKWIQENHRLTQFIFHIGARTDTTEFNKAIFDKLNLNYSKEIWNLCVEFGLPIVYASSAATYGDGAYGYNDSHSIVEKLKPLNPYGESKNDFDNWVLKQERKPGFWAGLKFFNVYGPNEYHKGRMASVVFHAYNQINQNGKVKLFRSHNPNYKDGEQLRDFVYVKDVTAVCLWMLLNRKHSGIYNLGTGKANTFIELANAIFSSLKKKNTIEFIDTPTDLQNTYQYFTEAKMEKLRAAGFNQKFYTLYEGIADYVQSYLLENKHY